MLTCEVFSASMLTAEGACQGTFSKNACWKYLSQEASLIEVLSSA